MTKLTEEKLRALVARQDVEAVVREFNRLQDRANELSLRLTHIEDQRDSLADDVHDLQVRCDELQKRTRANVS